MYCGSKKEWKIKDEMSVWWTALEQNKWIESFCESNPTLMLYGEVCLFKKYIFFNLFSFSFLVFIYIFNLFYNKRFSEIFSNYRMAYHLILTNLLYLIFWTLKTEGMGYYIYNNLFYYLILYFLYFYFYLNWM